MIVHIQNNFECLFHQLFGYRLPCFIWSPSFDAQMDLTVIRHLFVGALTCSILFSAKKVLMVLR